MLWNAKNLQLMTNLPKNIDQNGRHLLKKHYMLYFTRLGWGNIAYSEWFILILMFFQELNSYRLFHRAFPSSFML